MSARLLLIDIKLLQWQVWFRVNQQLPMELQKHLPDGSTSAADMRHPTSDANSEGNLYQSQLLVTFLFNYLYMHVVEAVLMNQSSGW